jgi:hypothetical protein
VAPGPLVLWGALDALGALIALGASAACDPFTTSAPGGGGDAGAAAGGSGAAGGTGGGAGAEGGRGGEGGKAEDPSCAGQLLGCYTPAAEADSRCGHSPAGMCAPGFWRYCCQAPQPDPAVFILPPRAGGGAVAVVVVASEAGGPYALAVNGMCPGHLPTSCAYEAGCPNAGDTIYVAPDVSEYLGSKANRFELWANDSGAPCCEGTTDCGSGMIAVTVNLD